MITEDAAAARTLADLLGEGNPRGYIGGHVPTATFSRDGAQGAALAIGGPLSTPTLTGRGHPADRRLSWRVARKAATRALDRRSRGATTILIATSRDRDGELAALQAMRETSTAAPKATRHAKRVEVGHETTSPWDPDAGNAAEAAAAIDAHWAALLADVAPGAGVHTLPALGLLSGRPTPAEVAEEGLRRVGIAPTAIDELVAFGLAWRDSAVELSPAGQMLVDHLLGAAPGLLLASVATTVREVVGQVADGTMRAERAIDRARQLLREVAPMDQVIAPPGFTEGRVLGACPTCGMPMRPRRGGDGRLRLACCGGERAGCGLAYPLPTEAVAHPGGLPCACGAPNLRVVHRGWWSAPRCAAGTECPEVGR